jgi:hypothetical protein
LKYFKSEELITHVQTLYITVNIPYCCLVDVVLPVFPASMSVCSHTGAIYSSVVWQYKYEMTYFIGLVTVLRVLSSPTPAY